MRHFLAIFNYSLKLFRETFEFDHLVRSLFDQSSVHSSLNSQFRKRRWGNPRGFSTRVAFEVKGFLKSTGRFYFNVVVFLWSQIEKDCSKVNGVHFNTKKMGSEFRFGRYLRSLESQQFF